MKRNPAFVIFITIVIIILGLIAYAIKTSSTQSQALEPFAQCIADSGATFYGAFWCPHCNEQKSLFGRAHKALPYVECSTPDGNGQTEVCIEEGIESYPTWKFADGSVQSGVIQLEGLAIATGCPLVTEEEDELEESLEEEVQEETGEVAEEEETQAEVDISSQTITPVLYGEGDFGNTEEESPEAFTL